MKAKKEKKSKGTTASLLPQLQKINEHPSLQGGKLPARRRLLRVSHPHLTGSQVATDDQAAGPDPTHQGPQVAG